MKVAQKMVLIPEEEYHSLTKPKSEFQKDVKEILKKEKDYDSATKMSQLVGSYIRHKQARETKEKPDDLFIDHFKPLYHSKVSLFMKQLQDNNIKWNDNRELILPSGLIVPHTNIIDLITEAVVHKPKKRGEEPTPRPNGWDAFINAIASSTIPKSFFTKKSTLAAFNRQDGWEVY